MGAEIVVLLGIYDHGPFYTKAAFIQLYIFIFYIYIYCFFIFIYLFSFIFITNAIFI